jgi:site-specific DNA recombinase
MAQAPANVPDVHPNVANIYRIKVATFTGALDDPDGGGEAAETIRSLIGEVILKPGPKRGQVEAELRGELMGILDFTGSPQNRRVGEVRTNAVARPRFEPTSRPSRMFCDQTRFRSRRQRTCSPGKIPSRNSIRNQRAAHTRNCRDAADSAPRLDYFW